MLAELLELVPSGVEEVTLEDGTVEYAVYGVVGELPAVPDLTAAAGDALVEVSSAEIADDWQDRWRSFHGPVVIDERLTVRPPWEPSSGRTRLDVVIDPGRAFGTGAHPTTRMCLEFLLSLEPTGALVDLGCGSGVLAITAAKLGFAPVRALDLEPAAVEATRENARRNGIELDEVSRFDVRSEAPPQADTVVANLSRTLLVALAPRLRGGVGNLIISGLLREETDLVTGVFVERGLRLRNRNDSADWTALMLG